jgi:uncharacterized repeat protein (TIGR03837 family)
VLIFNQTGNRMRELKSADIFCEVIDNFGDAGVCWRLARQLAQQEGLTVTLWINDLAPLKRLRPAIDPQQALQRCDGFTVRRWLADDIALAHPADLVIEAFGCKLSDATIAAMASREAPPVWINLEYLSAENWVEGCHRMPSPHPQFALTKYFYFPGFTADTGGLLQEAALAAPRSQGQADAQLRQTLLAQLGVQIPADAIVVSLFCYPFAPLETLLAALQSDVPVCCLVPQGVASDALTNFMQQPALAGARFTQGGLTVQILPFLEPDAYDQLLWCCDLNFVRGEDSLVRAQWAAQPFVWQLYRQDEDAHLVKMDAFLARFSNGLPEPLAARLRRCWQAWNGHAAAVPDWPGLLAGLTELRRQGTQWRAQLSVNGELSRGLVEFARKIG